MRRLISMALLGYGFYVLFRNRGDLFGVENYVAFGAIGFALVLEYLDND